MTGSAISTGNISSDAAPVITTAIAATTANLMLIRRIVPEFLLIRVSHEVSKSAAKAPAIVQGLSNRSTSGKVSAMKFRVLVVGLALSASSALALDAQVCRGGVDYNTSLVQGQIGFEVDDRSSLVAVSGGKGGPDWYGLGTIGFRTYDFRDGATVIFGFGGGRVFKHRFTGAAHNCVELRGEFGTGPDAKGPVRADESSSAMTLEASSGLPLRLGAATTLVPYGGFALRYASIVTQGDETSVSDKDFYELITVGLALGIRGAYAVQPYVQVPLGRDRSSDPLVGMRMSMSLGSKR
jgi:hypothetical protein